MLLTDKQLREFELAWQRTFEESWRSIKVPLGGYTITGDTISCAPKVKASRDSRGWLICQGPCAQPSEYAEAKEDGTFVCYSCKSLSEL